MTNKIALFQLNPIIGGLDENLQKIIQSIDKARSEAIKLAVFPEMALCGYPPEDLLLLPSFVEDVEHHLKQLIASCREITVIVGTIRKNPSRGEKGLYNTAALIENGELIGFQDKSLLPDYDVFSERRYFEPATTTSVWSLIGMKIAVTICEDIWQHADAVEYSNYQRDPILELKDQAPDLLINISASPYYYRRLDTRLNVCTTAAKSLNCPVLFCNQVGANDSLIFDGYSFCIDKKGHLAQYAKGFQEDILYFNPKEPISSFPSQPIEDLYKALVLGVRDYFYKLRFSKACFGLSGGIDSAVVACLAKEALGSENVFAFALPSRFSSKESVTDAETLANHLLLPFRNLSIDEIFQSYLDALAPFFEKRPQDVTEENLQARIRGMILMAFSNKFGYLLLGTGNKSELAMGYATLYGDMCGGLAVLSDVTKQQVYALARWINRNSEIIPQSTLEKAPSAELKHGQKDSDTLPAYEILDAVLEDYVEHHLSDVEIATNRHFSLPLVKEIIRKIHLAEYKRRQAPPGLRVTRRAFTVGRRFPIAQRWK